ncbi:PP2C family protein-serine/threonine phosphatase [Actinomadura rugatobispora]|uniref:PP2C family protein-serine/threonine phosphatase n=1 Tax=Actinomadura rugatobispora TaxID=1994 RepID=A0ABW1AJE8_9ACTN|nr:PP2C family protein-serine/threonine phosphatase [Actinomadura rugatobispora]
MRSAQSRDLEQALWDALPYELIGRARAAFEEHADAAGVEILLADYRQAYLVPTVSGGDPVRVDNTPEGHAFAAQRVVRGERDGEPVLHLPLSVHGDRLGVLSVRPSAKADEDLREANGEGPPWEERMESAAVVLARALKIADANTDLYRRIRRRTRLTLAAEMQWDLLPGRACDTGTFHLAGQLEPAYAVWGDNFDWSVSEDRLTLTVSNGTGTGTEAAALTHLAISALRNARRSGADIAEQAALADQTLYAHHRGTRHLATLLLDFEPATGRVLAIDAGSPRVYRMRGSTTEILDFEAQLPLGMFGDAHYTTEEFMIEPGDRLVVVSDGVHSAKSPAGELYGTLALLQALRETRLQNPSEAVRTFIRHFLAYHQGAEQVDDAVVVCLDWNGIPGSAPDAEQDSAAEDDSAAGGESVAGAGGESGAGRDSGSETAPVRA